MIERDGVRLGVINLSGNVFMSAGRSAFAEADALVARLTGTVDQLIVDMHAEATSEKVAMGWHLDGRVTAVIGTHTHVPTADARVLPGGTAYITDAGMTGSRAGVLGIRRELALEALVTQMPVRLLPGEEDPWLAGVLVSASEPMRADSYRTGPRAGQRAGPVIRESARRRPSSPCARRAGAVANSATKTSPMNHGM